MRLITVTSDNYLPSTLMMLESVRVWHPALPVTVYALEKGWNADHKARLREMDAEVEVIPEHDPRQRSGPVGTTLFAVWKIEVFLRQAEPFLFLDSDILALKPLDEVFRRVERDGWLSVEEGTTLGFYNQGDIAALSGLPEAAGSLKSFNTGVLGCDPRAHREVFELALEWSRLIKAIAFGDQGLINLAWHRVRGGMPPSAGRQFNGGFFDDGAIDLTNTILHFAGDHVWRMMKQAGRKRFELQHDVWSAWPKGVGLTNLRDTSFWERSLPHPWPWLNQCTQARHHGFVRRVREASLELRDTPWLLLRDRYEAHLLHRRVLAGLDAFWKREASRFSGLNYRPTYHLNPRGMATSSLRRRVARLCDDIRSLGRPRIVKLGIDRTGRAGAPVARSAEGSHRGVAAPIGSGDPASPDPAPTTPPSGERGT